MKKGTLIRLIRATGTLIDLPPKGPYGVEAKILTRGDTASVFVYGSDSVFDWILHFLPAWGGIAEEVYIAALAHEITARTRPETPVSIYGHSMGGAVAAALKSAIQNREVKTIGMGPKRPLTGYFDEVYWARGDIVPLLPPWRALPAKKIWKVGKRRLPWNAHKLSWYEQLLDEAEEPPGAAT
mgnify:FL=1